MSGLDSFERARQGGNHRAVHTVEPVMLATLDRDLTVQALDWAAMTELTSDPVDLATETPEQRTARFEACLLYTSRCV